MRVSPLTTAKVELRAARWAYAQLPTDAMKARLEAAEAAVARLEQS